MRHHTVPVVTCDYMQHNFFQRSFLPVVSSSSTASFSFSFSLPPFLLFALYFLRQFKLLAHTRCCFHCRALSHAYTFRLNLLPPHAGLLLQARTMKMLSLQ